MGGVSEVSHLRWRGGVGAHYPAAVGLDSERSRLVSVISNACGSAEAFLLIVANNLFLGFWTANSVPGFKQRDYMALYASLGEFPCLVYVFRLLSWR